MAEIKDAAKTFAHRHKDDAFLATITKLTATPRRMGRLVLAMDRLTVPVLFRSTLTSQRPNISFVAISGEHGHLGVVAIGVPQ